MMDRIFTSTVHSKSNDNPPIIITQTTLGTGTNTQKGGKDK